MKKTILTLAFMAIAMVSCQDKTKEKVEDATQAVGTEMEAKMDTVAAKANAAIDSTQAKAANALEKGAAKMDAAAEKMKEASKK